MKERIILVSQVNIDKAIFLRIYKIKKKKTIKPLLYIGTGMYFERFKINRDQA